MPTGTRNHRSGEFARLAYLSLGAVLVFSLLVYQLFVNSVLRHDQVYALALRQQITKQEVAPRRGTIYAKTKEGLYPFATTNELFSISAVPRNIKNKPEAAQKLSPILGLDEKEIFNRINNDRLYIPPLVKRADQAKAKEVSELNIVGVMAVPEYVRYYPEGGLASSLLGFVNFEGKGNYGVEGYFNEDLSGYSGSVLAMKDNKGRLLDILEGKNEARNGDSLVLTIDQNVQFVATEKLKAALQKYGAISGQVIIVEVKTGAVVAMVSEPAFDPNKFNDVKPEDQNIFVNQAIGSVYEPGSIMKPIVVAAGLDAGKIKPEDEGTFGNMVMVQGYEIHTAQDKAFGKENITQILENSDNVAMVSVGEKIGSDTLFDYFQKFGFGTKYGLDSDGETTGKLLPLKQWRDIHRATMSFGQGISVTPLQMVMAYQVIGNNGKLVKPHLVEKIIKADGSEKIIEPKQLREILKPETVDALKRMLISVVERGHGKRAAVSGYKIGGKTGTAQIPKKDGGGYEEDAHIGSFGGLVPGDDPRFAMLVKLDRPTNVEFAESSAAPTFGEIAAYLLQYYQIPKSQ